VTEAATRFDSGTPPPVAAETAAPRPDFIEVEGTLYRHADYDTPVWSRANTRDGRWHRARPGLSVQYWSYSATAAWAEKLRAEGIRDADDIPLIRSRLWAGQVEFSAIADLTSPGWQVWLGLSPAALVADEYTRCQAAAERLIACGANGLVTYSAALPDHLNLVIFRRLSLGDWIERPQGRPAGLRFPERLMPCHLLATGHPRPELVHRVVYKTTVAT